jgi:four helix bundle protein
MESWKELKVWQKAHSLVLDIYKLTAKFPSQERFRLTDQLCRAAASIPANIVEGQARQTTKEYIHFLYNARGSLEETRYHLLLARDLGLVNADRYAEIETDYEELSRMLNGLIQSLKQSGKRETGGESQ